MADFIPSLRKTLDTIEDLLDSIEDLLGSVQNVSTGLDLTVAHSITLDGEGRNTIAVYASSTTATDFSLDVSPDGVHWITGVNPTPDAGAWANSTMVRFEGFTGFRYARLNSAAAGASGDTVDLIIQFTR